MVHDALEVVRLRNDFYRDNYRKLVVAVILSLLIIVSLIFTLMMVLNNRPTPKYFATTDSGRIIPLVPLEQPNLTDKALLQWVSEAVVSVYSYNFQNFREIFQENRNYFTAAGWQSFMAALTASKNLDTVQNRRLVVSAVLVGAPVILSKYVLEGRYNWRVQMPILVTYQGTNDRITQNFVITVRIQRISTLDSIAGVGVAEFVAQQR